MHNVSHNDDQVLIEAEHVSKKFCRSLRRSLWYGARDITSALVPRSHKSIPGNGKGSNGDFGVPPALRTDEFWALQDVSFELRRGECLGLIGHNGAGKSTLLKILNGLIRPDAGRVTMRGRVGALIELNAGFNPILTGRENIYNQATLLGFTKEETRSRFDDIVEFSELESFLDMPVQNYSSGMRVRLGFAIASQMEPDILLIDEVLAVGDVGFRAKCLSRMAELREKCGFLFVSHSMPQVARISTAILHLDHGKTVVLTRNLAEGIASYYSGFKSIKRGDSGTGEVRLDSVKARVNDSDAGDGQIVPVNYGDSIEFTIDSAFVGEPREATVQLVIWSQEMIPVIDLLGPGLKRFAVRPSPDGRSRIRARIDDVTLNSGRYSVSVIVLSPDGLTTLCQVDRALELEVSSNFGSSCSITLCGDWSTGTPDVVV